MMLVGLYLDRLDIIPQKDQSVGGSIAPWGALHLVAINLIVNPVAQNECYTKNAHKPFQKGYSLEDKQQLHFPLDSWDVMKEVGPDTL